MVDIIVWVVSILEVLEINLNVLKKFCLLIDGGYFKNMVIKVQ